MKRTLDDLEVRNESRLENRQSESGSLRDVTHEQINDDEKLVGLWKMRKSWVSPGAPGAADTDEWKIRTVWMKPGAMCALGARRMACCRLSCASE